LEYTLSETLSALTLRVFGPDLSECDVIEPTDGQMPVTAGHHDITVSFDTLDLLPSGLYWFCLVGPQTAEEGGTNPDGQPKLIVPEGGTCVVSDPYAKYGYGYDTLPPVWHAACGLTDPEGYSNGYWVFGWSNEYLWNASGHPGQMTMEYYNATGDPALIYAQQGSENNPTQPDTAQEFACTKLQILNALYSIPANWLTDLGDELFFQTLDTRPANQYILFHGYDDEPYTAQDYDLLYNNCADFAHDVTGLGDGVEPLAGARIPLWWWQSARAAHLAGAPDYQYLRGRWHPDPDNWPPGSSEPVVFCPCDRCAPLWPFTP